jgi:GC-rich sequence DNA-binding factor
MFLKAAVTPYRAAVEELEQTIAPYMALNRPRFDPEAIPARKRILARMSKLLDSILRWRKYAGDLSGIGLLVTRLVENSVLPIAESGWEVGGEAAARKVSNLCYVNISYFLTPSPIFR